MRHMSFPGAFINLLAGFSLNSSSLVLANGTLCRHKPIIRPVRQGCPLSMILFVVYLEPLLRSLSHNLTGMPTGMHSFKLNACADVTCINLTEREVIMAQDVLKIFQELPMRVLMLEQQTCLHLGAHVQRLQFHQALTFVSTNCQSLQFDFCQTRCKHVIEAGTRRSQQSVGLFYMNGSGIYTFTKDLC